MKYYKATFQIAPFSEDYADVLAALLADAGFETYATTDNGLEAYIQQSLYQSEAVERATEEFPIPGVTIHYNIYTAEDENWNETWEREGFRPIVIGNSIAVHSAEHNDIPPVEYDIRINPCQTFGTGSHQTTRMILEKIAAMDLQGKKVVDAGTGTGILAIMALMRGAEQVIAYDIDDRSVENARLNLALNNMDQKRVEIRQGDAGVICDVKSVDLLIANINRNILLADLPAFAGALGEKGKILLSGFYTDDIPVLLEKAESLGLSHEGSANDGEWACLLLSK